MSLGKLRESYSKCDMYEDTVWEGDAQIPCMKETVERYLLVFADYNDAKHSVLWRNSHFTDGDFLVGETTNSSRYLRIHSDVLRRPTFIGMWDSDDREEDGPFEVEAFFHQKSKGHGFLTSIMEESDKRVDIYLIVDDNDRDYLVDITSDVHAPLLQYAHQPCAYCQTNEDEADTDES